VFPDYQLDDMALRLLRYLVPPCDGERPDGLQAGTSPVIIPVPSLRSRSVMLHDALRAKAGGYRDGWYINDAGSKDIANVGSYGWLF
jgi:hypothetical protein